MSTAYVNQRAGFTIMEVLAVLLLMGLVLPVVLRGASLALGASSHARRITEASALANQRLEEILLSGRFTADSGRFDSPWQDYQWSATISSRDYNLTEIAVEVRWQARSRTHSVRLVTLAGSASAVTP